ncbi:hypothetical protein HDU67_002362 [Dinochytrium kinnereticum]|nr:hypothetical protein HDU67_002362 [Dinochytrium kinnereticum]
MASRKNSATSDTTAKEGGPMKRTQTLVHLLDTKTISMFGGITLLFNNMTGPAVPQTPNIFQQSGWLIVLFSLATFSTISTLCSLFIVEAMQAIPGNKHFQGTVEFGTLIHFYFGRWAHIIGQICLYGALESNAVASMIQTSQTFDNIIVDIFRKTCGFALTPSMGFVCISERSESLSVFGERTMLFTLGYLVMMFCVMGLSRITLSESVWMQVGSFIITFMIFFLWVVISLLNGVKSEYVPAVGDSSGFGGLFGIIMLNFSFCASVPSWINIKKSDVNAQGTLWLATLTGFLTYSVVGLIPALSFVVPNSSNLISVMGSGSLLGRIVGHFFSLVILLPSIPVFMVIEHANLEQNFNFKKLILVFPLLGGSGLANLNVWASLIFVSTANFIVPLLIYLQAIKFRKKYNQARELTEEQKKLLKKIHWQSRTINQFIDQYAIIKGKILETRASSMLISASHNFGLGGKGLGDLPSRTFSATGLGSTATIGQGLSVNPSRYMKTSAPLTRFDSKKGMQLSAAGVWDGNFSNMPSSTSLNGSRACAYGLLVPRASQTGAILTERMHSITTDGSTSPELRSSLPRDRAVIGSSGTIATDTGANECDEEARSMSSSNVGMLGSENIMWKKKISLVVLDEDGLPAITVDPPSTFNTGNGMQLEPPGGDFYETCLTSRKSLGSIPNSGRNSVVVAIGSDNKSLSSCRISIGSKPRESLVSIKDIRAITFEDRSRQSSTNSKYVPKLALNGEEAAVEEDSDDFFMIETFLLEDVPDPDMEDEEEEEYRFAALNSADIPRSPSDEVLGSPVTTPVRGRLQSLAALFRSKESLNDSRSNLSRAGSSIFGLGSIRSLATSIKGTGNGGGNLSSPTKKKRPPRARMGSARSNFSFASDTSSRNHGDRNGDGGQRDSLNIRNRVVSIDSISVVEEEEADGAMTPTNERAQSLSGIHTNGFESSLQLKNNEQSSSQETAEGSSDLHSAQVPAVIVIEESSKEGGKDHFKVGLAVVYGSDGAPNVLFNRSTSYSSGSAIVSNSNGKLGSIASFQGLRSPLRDSAANRTGGVPTRLHQSDRLGGSREGSVIHSPGLLQPPLLRRRSLPTHPDFVSKAFRSIPRWVPVRAKVVAIFCIVVTSMASLSNLVYNLITVIEPLIAQQQTGK